MKILENVMFMGFFGEGYHSGAVETVGIAFKEEHKEVVVKYIECLESLEYHFYELDGKHSCVEGDYIDYNNLEDILDVFHDSDFSDSFILDLKYVKIDEEDKVVIEEVIELNTMLANSQQIVKTTYKLFDKEGNLIKTT